ncbi:MULTISPECIES: MFS transporter [unclassified Bacillus (in: firmicutes)]|uniref:MFS transporter n=1 Tax=unclassified Bacillus (in: firmicutes) TaxID=185979 RepID=UPI0020362215|nr:MULTISPECIES: MFS transporter [unclassified Bacillus (in: firmicutes)]
MISEKKRHTFYYGWVIVCIAGLGSFFSGPGQTYSNSVFIDEYIKSFGWTRSEISSLYSFATLCSGILMMFMGRLVDKLGQRKMMVIVSLLLGLACFFNSFVVNTWMMAIGFFLIRLFGQGSMTLIPNTLVPQWFIQKRGRAMSFMALGGVASAAFFPVANAWLIRLTSWQTTWQIWGVLLIVLFAPLAFFIVRNRPEDIGLHPDGKPIIVSKNNKHSDKTMTIQDDDWTLQEAMRTRTFWAILICVGIPALVNTGITFHLLSIFGQNQLSPQLAATVLSLMAIIGFPISFISGFILERVSTNRLLIFVFVLEVLTLFLLTKMNSATLGILFGVIWGIGGGVERITLNIVWSNYFGRKYLGSISGVAMMVMVIGSACGPLPLGIGFDKFHSYNESLLLLMFFPMIGLISAAIAKKPDKQKFLIKNAAKVN